MSKPILPTLLLLLIMLTNLVSLPALQEESTIRGSVNRSSIPQTVVWTIKTAFLSKISRTGDSSGYLIDGKKFDIQDITDYISREYLLPIPEAGELSYRINGKIGAEPEIHIPIHTFSRAGTAQVSVYQYAQGTLQPVWLPGSLTFTITFSPKDGKLPEGYTVPPSGNGEVPKNVVQNLQLPAAQEQFEKEYTVFIDRRDRWSEFFNTNLQSRQTKRITMHPDITGNNPAEKTVSWIKVKFSGADLQQLSSTINKLEAKTDEPHLASNVNTLLNWGVLLIDKSGPFHAVLSETSESVISLKNMLTYYAYNTQTGEVTDFNFEKNRMLISKLLKL